VKEDAMRQVTLVCVLALAAGVALAQGRPREEFVPPLAWLSSESVPHTRGHFDRYSATKIQVLVFNATVSPLVRGEHRLGLRVYTPRGHLYQTLSVPFVVPTHPQRRHAPPPPPTLLSVRLPVAGTPIVANTLYGRWRVVPHLDDADERCGYDHHFWIAR
jgi:hypothetical protein